MYLNPTELNSVLYEELQEAITRGDDTLVQTHINDAMAFVESKLSQKYNVQTEYAKRGKQRHSLIVKYVRDIAVYYCYDLAETIPAKRVKAYDDAVKFLDDAKRGDIVISGLDTAEQPSVTDSATGVTTWGGQRKRINSFYGN
jgi:phage gp36-like protein